MCSGTVVHLLVLTVWILGIVADDKWLPRPPRCGTFPEDRFVSGPITHIDDYPWTALLFHKNDDYRMLFACTGALINEKYVLTAANCVSDKLIRSSTYTLSHVRLGEWDLRTMPDCESTFDDEEDCADPHLDVPIERAIVYPHFKTNVDNIALVALKSKVNFSDFISPVCLPTARDLQFSDYQDHVYHIVGWYPGNEEWGTKKVSNILRTYIGQSECTKVFKSLRREIRIKDNQLCFLTRGYDLCPATVGAPLTTMVDTPGGSFHYLLGIFSFGPYSCDVSEKPYVFTKIESYVDWIHSTIGREARQPNNL